MTIVESAGGSVPAAERRDCPYFGLSYYDERSASWFFGRETEIGRIITNLRASRLTLVHADSGVGKSSLLRAGVAAQLRELALSGAARPRRPRFVPVVFSKWTDDPLPALIGAIREAVEPSLDGRPPEELTGSSLTAAITAAARAVNATLLVILDQFEEYFLYCSSESPPQRLADELARAINDANLPANFVIAIREDAYAGLGDLFKGRIENVYGNYLDLAYLTREAGAEAIKRPVLDVYNRQSGVRRIEIEPELVTAVLDQVRAHGGADDDPQNGHANGDGRIAAPLLQLVMERLWQQERAEQSTVLRLETLERMEGVEHIVDAHLAGALRRLGEHRDVVIDAFDHLVTPSGGKIAQSIPDLALRTSHTEDQLAAALDPLVQARILRPVAPPPGRGQRFRRYEIFHDVLAPAINRAIATHQEQRLKQARVEAEEQARKERDRARRARSTAIVAAALALIALVLGAVALVAWRSAVADRNKAQSRRLAASAEATVTQNPELATLLALAAIKADRTREAEAALRDALPRLHQIATLAPPAAPRSVAFSTNGSRIVTASADGRITIWGASSHAPLISSGGPRGAFAGPSGLDRAAMSPSGSRVVTVYEDGTARVWDARTGELLRVLATRNGEGLSGAAFSPDGARIVTAGGDGSARVWDSRSYQQIAVAKQPERRHVLLSAVFSPDGREILGASSSGQALIWNARSGALLRTMPNQYGLLDAEFSRDGRLVITASGGGTARIWNAQTGTQLRSLTPPVAANQSIYNMWVASFSPDGQRAITAGGDGIVRVWSVANGKLLRAFPSGGGGTIVSAVYSPDGKQVVGAAAGGAQTVWNGSTGKRIGVLRESPGLDSLRSAVFAPDSAIAATGSRFGTLTLWRHTLENGRPKWRVLAVVALPENDAINAMAFSPDDSVVATATESGRVWLWTVPSGAPDGEISAGGGQKLNSVAFDPRDPNHILTAGDDQCAGIFDIATAKQVGTSMCEPSWAIRAAAFSPDGHVIVTGDQNGDAQAWNASTQRPMGKSFVNYGSPITSIAFDGRGRLVVAAGSTAQIYDAASHRYMSVLTEPGTSIVRSAAYSPDGRTVVTGGTNALAHIWDVSSQQQLLTLGGHGGPIETVAFDASGTEVISASADGTAKIWDPRPVEQQTLLPGTLPLTTVAYDPAEPSLLATVGAFGSHGALAVWDLRHPARPLATFGERAQTGAGASGEFSNDGRLLVTTAGTEQAQIYRVADILRDGSGAKPLGSLDASRRGSLCAASQGALISGFNSAIFSYDNRFVATADNNGDACIWSTTSYRSIRLIKEPLGGSGGTSGSSEGSAPLRWVQFSRDGKRLLTASDDGTARIWNVATGGPLQVLTEPTREALNDAWFSPDDRLVVTASDAGTVGIWNANTGTEIRQLVVSDHSQVFNAAFSPDHKWILTCGGGSSEIFSVSGQHLTAFPYGSDVSDCEFSPNGRFIATAGDGGETRVFSTELAGQLKKVESIAKQRVTLQLTPAERAQYGVS
jgi:WD40 repeat protein